MKKKIAALIAAGLMTLTVASCSSDTTVSVRKSDIKVEPNGTTMTYIRYRNGYRMGDVNITANEDGSYTITVIAIPPDRFLAP